MIKVFLWEAYGSGGVAGPNGKPHQYWSYQTTIMVKGSIKKAIKYARRKLYEEAKDKEGFNWIPVIGEMKVYKNNKLIIKKD